MTSPPFGSNNQSVHLHIDGERRRLTPLVECLDLFAVIVLPRTVGLERRIFETMLEINHKPDLFLLEDYVRLDLLEKRECRVAVEYEHMADFVLLFASLGNYISSAEPFLECFQSFKVGIGKRRSHSNGIAAEIEISGPFAVEETGNVSRLSWSELVAYKSVAIPAAICTITTTKLLFIRRIKAALFPWRADTKLPLTGWTDFLYWSGSMVHTYVIP